MTKPDETECQRTPTPNEMAKRIGVLFVLAMQTNDVELREAAYIDKSELGMTDGPVFLPIDRLTKERDDLRAALEEIAEGRDSGRHDGLPEQHPIHDADTMFALARRALQSLNISGGE